ncbi:MAG: hypothetical protein IKL49_02445 [Lachnospiraceae bacterium]|nr:hypothetical protein [Lachnospiraceae bacterium]
MGKKDTLVIIGNGFDIWQGYRTSYLEFQKYYLKNRDNILKKLHIKKHVYIDEDGQKTELTDVEIIYGNPFNPNELEDEFWGTFETSLDDIDAETINAYFGKDAKGLRNMRKSIRNANRILKEAFCSWIKEVHIESSKSQYDFGDNCLFINFNYTDTLVKRLGIKEDDEYHIHGEAKDKKSIIFGHASHPQLPEQMLYKMGGRFRGLYYIEEILYYTDKHVEDNMQALCMFLAVHGTYAQDIKHIYVLGHSMSLPDIQYFMFLNDATKIPDEEEKDNEDDINDYDETDELFQRLQYAVNHTGYSLEDEDIEEEQKQAVIRQYQKEQKDRNNEYEKMFVNIMKKKCKIDISQNIVTTQERKEDAMWHISYYSENDKIWIEEIMGLIGCKNFCMHSTIEECIQKFRC